MLKKYDKTTMWVAKNIAINHKEIRRTVDFVFKNQTITHRNIGIAFEGFPVWTADLDYRIEELPDGYETILGERGGTLSGGQRQCVAIARAIIKNTPIVILDEPTTGLDNQSASVVMGALRELMNGKTVIIISHQLEAIQDVDRVVVLQDGKIIQEGTPSKLLSDKGLYQELYESKFLR